MSEREPQTARLPSAGLSVERRIVLWLVALFLIAAIFHLLSSVLAPFIAGLALGYLLDPIADRLQALGLSRLGASLLIVSVFLVVFIAVLLLIAPALTRQFADFIQSLPGYLATLQALLARLGHDITGDAAKSLLERLGLGSADTAIDMQKYVNDIASEVAAMAGSFVKSLVSGGAALVNMASLVVITPVVAFYILLDWDHMVATIDELVPPRHRPEVRAIARDINKALAGFLRGQALVCLFLGLWYSIGLSLLGLEFGFLIGVCAGVLSFVPYVGSITAFVLSIIVATVQGWPDWRLPAEAIGVVGMGLFLDGNVLSPRLVGGSIGVHPVWLMFALLAFGTLFGFTGLLLAAPLAAAIGVISRFVLRRYRHSALFLGPGLGRDDQAAAP